MMLADQITGAPDDAWTAIGMIGGAAAAALVYGVIKLIQKWRTPEPQTTTIAGQQYDVTGMSESLVRMLSDALEKSERQDQRIQHLEQEQDSLRTVNLNLHGQLVVVKPALRTLTTWVDAGANPPPPHIPQDARQALEVDPREP